MEARRHLRAVASSTENHAAAVVFANQAAEFPGNLTLQAALRVVRGHLHRVRLADQAAKVRGAGEEDAEIEAELLDICDVDRLDVVDIRWVELRVRQDPEQTLACDTLLVETLRHVEARRLGVGIAVAAHRHARGGGEGAVSAPDVGGHAELRPARVVGRAEDGLAVGSRLRRDGGPRP